MRIVAILTATVAGFLCGVWSIRRKVKTDPALKAAEEYAAQLDKDIDKQAREAWEDVRYCVNKQYFISGWKIPKNVV